jgi:hypothetical protein
MVDPHLVRTLRESFARWVSARALTPIAGSPDLRFAGRLANRDVQVAIGISHEDAGPPRVGAPLILVACPELAPLVPAPMMVGAHGSYEGDAPEAMMLFVLQSSPTVASVSLMASALAVRLTPASGPNVVDRAMASLDVVLRELHGRRVKSVNAGPYRSG